MIEISNLIHRYYDLNKIYNNILLEKRMCFNEQVEICEFYEYASEKRILDNILKNKLTTDKIDNYSYLLNNLRNQLQENIALYLNSIKLLENLPIKGICDYKILKYENQIARQEIKIAAFRQRFNEANKSLESTAYVNFKENEILTRTRYYNQSKMEYQEQQEILQGFFLEHKQMQYQICKYNQSQFKKVYELSKFLLEELSDEIKLYFDKSLINAIYFHCNNNIFESASEEEYQNLFNSLKSDTYLTEKNGTKTYICYLVHFLLQFVQNEDKNLWLKTILNRLKIEREKEFDKRRTNIEMLAKAKSDPAKNKKAKQFYNSLSIIKNQFESKK